MEMDQELKAKVEQLKSLRDTLDLRTAYSYGMYNGLETALAVLEKRAPVYQCIPFAE